MPISGLDESRARLEQLRTSLDLSAKEEELRVLEAQSGREDFWDDADKARAHLRHAQTVKDWVEGWHGLDDRIKAISDLYDMAHEEGDEATEEELLGEFAAWQKDLQALERKRMLDGPDDARPAILTIHPGAGGTESADWAAMLMRMYQRYFEKCGWRARLLDLQEGEEAGIKSATFEIPDEYAFGFLRSEIGVHRLVRISPFDAAARRHTSFAAVYVYPVVEDVEVEINEKDIRVDTYRSSGAGGQHINKTDSAVRMTHIPTGIVVTCQNERSQIQNREKALQVLKAAVYERMREEEEAKRSANLASKLKVEWGSQIRNYVLHPYNLVKDVRTGTETSDTAAVLDGDLQPFVDAYLLASSQEKK